MLRKLLVITLISLALTILTGCPGDWTDHYIIKGIDLNGAVMTDQGADKSFNHYEPVIIFENAINFVLTDSIVFISYSSPYSPRCYATTIGSTIDNGLIQETFNITLDKPFIYDGDTIFSQTNILELRSISKEVDIFKNHSTFNSSQADRVIAMSNVFIEKAKFDTTAYKVIFSCKTTDNRILADSVTVKFRI